MGVGSDDKETDFIIMKNKINYSAVCCVVMEIDTRICELSRGQMGKFDLGWFFRGDI